MILSLQPSIYRSSIVHISFVYQACSECPGTKRQYGSFVRKTSRNSQSIHPTELHFEPQKISCCVACYLCIAQHGGGNGWYERNDCANEVLTLKFCFIIFFTLALYQLLL